MTPTLLSLDGSAFNDRLEMDFVGIGGNLSMANAAFHDVHMEGAKIGGQLEFSGSTFQESLDMLSVSVGGDLFMTDAPVFHGAVAMRGMTVGDQFFMNHAKFDGNLDLDSAIVTGDFIVRGDTQIQTLILRGMQVGDQLSMIGVRLEALNMNGSSIGGSILMRDAAVSSNANLRFLHVGRNLDLRGGIFTGMDLSGARVQGMLRLADQLTANAQAIRWDGSESALLLRGASVVEIEDAVDSWPDVLQLDGFTYQRFSRLGTPEASDENARALSAKRFVAWLARDDSYSQQPYRQLARVLSAAGHEAMADAVLDANRRQQRERADGARWLWLTALGTAIDLGLLDLRGIYGIFGLVVLGCVVLRFSPEQGKGIWYSVDMVLPVVRLNEDHYTNPPASWAIYYFYAHQLIGYVLVFFVLAGLSGLVR